MNKTLIASADFYQVKRDVVWALFDKARDSRTLRFLVNEIAEKFDEEFRDKGKAVMARALDIADSDVGAFKQALKDLQFYGIFQIALFKHVDTLSYPFHWSQQEPFKEFQDKVHAELFGNNTDSHEPRVFMVFPHDDEGGITLDRSSTAVLQTVFSGGHIWETMITPEFLKSKHLIEFYRCENGSYEIYKARNKKLAYTLMPVEVAMQQFRCDPTRKVTNYPVRMILGRPNQMFLRDYVQKNIHEAAVKKLVENDMESIAEELEDKLQAENDLFAYLDALSEYVDLEIEVTAGISQL